MSTIKNLVNKRSQSRIKEKTDLINFDNMKSKIIDSFFSELFNTKDIITDKEREFQKAIFSSI